MDKFLRFLRTFNKIVWNIVGVRFPYYVHNNHKYMNRKLTIKNPSALVHTVINNEYELYDVHTHSDKYVFEFRYSVSYGSGYDITNIILSRNGKWDDEYQKWMYQIDNIQHWVSADWFGIKENAIKTFEDYLN